MVSHIGVLPQDVLDTLMAQMDAPEEQRGMRFLRLPHPRTGIPSLFIPYQSSSNPSKMSIAEVQTVEPHNKRSWFMPQNNTVLENGRLLIMTPVDPAFLLIPILVATVPLDGSAGTFRPLDDILEDAVDKLCRSPPAVPNPKDLSTQICADDLTQFLELDCVRIAMKRVCEVKAITPEIVVYRYSQEQVIESLKTKVTRLVVPDVFESSKTLIRALAKDGLMEDGKESLLDSGRLRAACDLVSQYLPLKVYTALLASYDFAALDAYMKALSDEAAEIAAAKMDKLEARESKTSADAHEKKRKNASKASHGVEQLKKANTKGMAKLSTFFQAKSSKS